MCVLKENDPAESKTGHVNVRGLYFQTTVVISVKRFQKVSKFSVSDWEPNTPTT